MSMLDSCSQGLPDDLLQSFVHTKSFQSWLQGQKSIIVAEFGSEMIQAEPGNLRQSSSSLIASSLARYAAKRTPEGRVFYVDCTWALENPQRTGTRVHQLQQKESESSISTANKAMALLFLQIFCSQSQQEQLLLECLTQLPHSAQSEFQSVLADTGLPPAGAIVPVIAYILTKKSGRGYYLAIENMELCKPSEKARLLYDLEVLCATPQAGACIAVSQKPGDMTLYKAHPYICESTEYREFLGSLYFQDIEARRMQVSPATAETNSWIWSNSDYVAFSGQESGILWIRGKPGSGKSVLAKFIRDTLLKRLQAKEKGESGRALVGDWFYHRRGGGHYIRHYSFLRSILYHLSEQSPGIFVSFCRDTYRLMDPHSISWSEETLKRTIINICQGPMPVICIVDAVDEAESADILSVIKEFAGGSTRSKAKFIVLSRPVVAIEQQVIGCRSIVMEMENQSDIEKIVCKGIESLPQALHALDLSARSSTECVPRPRGQPRMPRMKQPRSRSMGIAMAHEQLALQEIQRMLISNAQGSILWVKLVLDQLLRQASSSWTCTLDGLRQAAMQIPHELKEYYSQIVSEMLRHRSQEDIENMRRLLMWICAAGEIGDVTLERLWEAVAIMRDNFASSTMDEMWESRMLLNSYDELWRKIYLTCGPFIEIYYPGLSVEESRGYHYGAASVVQLMHQSVRDFLTESPSAAELSFTIAGARDFVQRHLTNYLRITGEFLHKKDSNNSQLDCAELLDYLDDRKLLELALSPMKDGATADSSVKTCFNVKIPPLHDPSPQSLEFHLSSALSINVHTFEDFPCVLEQTPKHGLTSRVSLTRTHLAANRLFYKACSDGLVTAVLNMLALGWDRESPPAISQPIVMYGVILAASTCQIKTVHVECNSRGVSNDTELEDSSKEHEQSSAQIVKPREQTDREASGSLPRHTPTISSQSYAASSARETGSITDIPETWKGRLTNQTDPALWQSDCERCTRLKIQCLAFIDKNGARYCWSCKSAGTECSLARAQLPPPPLPPLRRPQSIKQEIGADGEEEAQTKMEEEPMSVAAAGYRQGTTRSPEERRRLRQERLRHWDGARQQSQEERQRRLEQRRRRLEEAEFREKQRKAEERREKERYQYEDRWVAARWQVTVWVDNAAESSGGGGGGGGGGSSLLPRNGRPNSSAWTCRFKEWSSFLDLTCGTKVRALQQQQQQQQQQQGGWVVDYESGRHTGLDPVPEDVEQAIAVAIRGAKKSAAAHSEAEQCREQAGVLRGSANK
ncbi:hypothetical protein V2A60_002256 [Cordyceps javanica]